MKLKISDDEISNLDFRKRKTKEKIKELESFFTGRQSSILPWIQDKPGIYSEKKLQAFIRELSDSLERYRQYENKDADYKMKRKEKDFYEAYLYCTIRGIVNSRWGASAWVASCRTFEDIINMAVDPETMRIHIPEELYYEELYEPVTGGFFGYMDETYKLLTGVDIAESITGVEKDRVYQLYPQALDIERELEKRKALEDDLSEEERQEILEDYEEVQHSQEVAAYILEIEENRKKWVQGFGDSALFCKYYKKYRKLYFEVERYRFVSDIEHMIDIFLMEQKISSFGSEDKFLKAYTVADRTCIRLKNLLKEGE